MTQQELIKKSRVLRARGLLKYGKTLYKYVKSYSYDGVVIFYANISIQGVQWSKTFCTIKEAAIAVDMKFIEKNLNPVNILKRK